MRPGRLRSFDGHLRRDLKGAARIWLPALHVRRVHAGGISDSVRSFYDGGKEQVVVVVTDLPLLSCSSVRRMKVRSRVLCPTYPMMQRGRGCWPRPRSSVSGRHYGQSCVGVNAGMSTFGMANP